MTDWTSKPPYAKRALALAGIGLLFVLVAVGLFATVPGALAHGHAYVNAPPCPPAGTRSDSCTTTVPATVNGTGDWGVGKGHDFWILLTERGSGTAHRVHLAGGRPGPVYDVVRTGDEVTVVYWRGEIRTVRFGALAQEAKASPTDDWRRPMTVGLGLLPVGLGFVWTG